MPRKEGWAITPQELDTFLRTPTQHELLYQQGWENPDHLRGMIEVVVNGRRQQVVDISQSAGMPLLSGNKHSRFHAYPPHIHPWVELVYMYSGSCTQLVNENPITLRAGQVLLLDQNTIHSLPVLGYNDILLNIIIRKEYLTSGFFSRLSQKNLLSQFFVNTITEGLSHDSYMFFPCENSRRLPLYVQEYFCELYEPSACASDILSSLLTLILTELIQVCSAATVEHDLKNTQDTSVLPILKYIEQNYAEISLKQTAAYFSLNPNYLSNLLKARTGSSFQQLVHRQRMIATRQLLLNSQLSVREIARRVGYENTSFFYKKFTEDTGCSPADYRSQPLP